MKLDPFHEGCLPIHITCLIELRKPNDLFLLAHRLVELYPEWTISWYVSANSCIFLLQLNEYEIDLYFLRFFQCNTTVCLIIHLFCESCEPEIVFVLIFFQNNFKFTDLKKNA